MLLFFKSRIAIVPICV